MWLPAPGATVAKYRLQRQLGAGGMGAVYLARDLDLDREVAIKFINTERATDETARRRLIHEARAAASLDHPNICAVHDVIVEPDGHAFIVMQYVEGETLSTKLQHGPLEPRQAFLITADVAAALAAAHKRGILHRDVKPQNIIITPAGKAKLLDFGIARLEEVVSADQRATTVTSLTDEGHVAGTPAYMSPEQMQLQPLDGRTDLFSLGAVLFECLTGRRAFEGRSDAELYSQILHEQPPAVSSARAGLSEIEDELCRRMLAKHPDDRFRSADELLGALRMLVPDTAHSSSASLPVRVEGRRIPRAVEAVLGSRKVQLAVIVLGVLALAGVWRWRSASVLPDPPPEAERWYVKGTQSIHDGAYHSGRLALQEAVKIFPDYALAYARLAEASNELDDSNSAQRALLMVDRLITDRSGVPTEIRLRLDAVRALALQDASAAVQAYDELARRSPNDASVWLDLGRAQEAASLPVARVSYERAIAVDRQYAAAHLRRASTLTQETNRQEALREFDEAERLYRAASNVEGVTEALLRRGGFLRTIGNVDDARVALERARALAVSVKNRPQELRARLRLSAVTAREGGLTDSLRLAGAAIDEALSGGLETVAAEGLIELTVTLLGLGRVEDAEEQIRRAIQLAEKAAAQRLLARARLQHAAVLIQRARPQEALAVAASSIDFVRARGYRRLELSGMSVMARAHEELSHYAEARKIAETVVRAAREVKEDTYVVQALDIIAGIAARTGGIPEALAYRLERESINRVENNTYQLAFDLVLRAELLIRLGRTKEAERVLAELDAGIASGIDAYRSRTRRVLLLRVLSATVDANHDVAARAAASLLASSGGRSDGITLQAAALQGYAEAHLGRRRAIPLADTTKRSGESLYWDLAARLVAGDAMTVLGYVTTNLDSASVVASYEYEWRLAALGAAAARRGREEHRAAQFSVRAQRALDRLRDAWKEDARPYIARRDVAELIAGAGLRSPF